MSDMNDMFGPGPSTRLPGFPDVLPTHPKEARQESMNEKYDFRVRVDQFDLADAGAKARYEQILTDITYGKKLSRQEKWSSDKDGSVTIAMSWIDLIPKRKKGTTGANQGIREPGPVHGSNPGLEDGAYPGQGAVLDSDGAVVQTSDQSKEEVDSEEPTSFDDM